MSASQPIARSVFAYSLSTTSPTHGQCADETHGTAAAEARSRLGPDWSLRRETPVSPKDAAQSPSNDMDQTMTPTALSVNRPVPMTRCRSTRLRWPCDIAGSVGQQAVGRHSTLRARPRLAPAELLGLPVLALDPIIWNRIQIASGIRAARRGRAFRLRRFTLGGYQPAVLIHLWPGPTLTPAPEATSVRRPVERRPEASDPCDKRSVRFLGITLAAITSDLGGNRRAASSARSSRRCGARVSCRGQETRRVSRRRGHGKTSMVSQVTA